MFRTMAARTAADSRDSLPMAPTRLSAAEFDFAGSAVIHSADAAAVAGWSCLPDSLDFDDEIVVSTRSWDHAVDDGVR